MKRVLLMTMALLVVAGSPAWAGSFSVFGAGWDTKDADQAMGGGLRTRLGWLDLRATYFADVTADTEPEHRDFEIRAIPLEVGVAFPLGPQDAPFAPYVGGGAGYYMLDVDNGEIDDEAGWYGVIGSDFGDAVGPRFNLEVMYRRMEATVTDERDINDPDIISDVDFDLSGFAVNAGVSWTF